MEINKFSDVINKPVSRVVVLTGAGVSQASGIPTYRGPQGIWTLNPDAERHSTPPPAKMSDPVKRRLWWDDIWALWGPARSLVKSTQPNAAHAALASWQDSAEVTVVTQNVDGLHQRAGNKEVFELHGSLFRTRCAKHRCSQPAWVDEEPHLKSPDCPKCGRPARPDMVLFTENLDWSLLEKTKRAIFRADLMVVTGTSGNVYPAAGFPDIARVLGVPVVLVNPEPWDNMDVFDVFVEATAEEALPSLVP